MPVVPVTTCHRGTLGLPCFELDPTTVTCPYCRNRVTTKILPRYEPMTSCESCWFPFLTCCSAIENHDIKHVCPNCNKVLGIYRYIEGMHYYPAHHPYYHYYPYPPFAGYGYGGYGGHGRYGRYGRYGGYGGPGIMFHL